MGDAQPRPVPISAEADRELSPQLTAIRLRWDVFGRFRTEEL